MPVHSIDPLQFISPTNFSFGLWTDSIHHLTLRKPGRKGILVRRPSRSFFCVPCWGWRRRWRF